MRQIIPARPNLLTGGTLDRAGHLREDAAWLTAAYQDGASRFVLFRDGRPLMTAGEPPRPSFSQAPAVDAPWIFLGRQNHVPLFAADLTGLDAAPLPPGQFLDFLEIAATIAADHATILASAKAVLHWRAKHRFCAFCGGPNIPIRGGYVLRCESCGTEHFPRSDPAVIMLVTRGETALLGQSLRFPPERNFYSALAGFVEPGENLEDAVRREVFEEVGVRVGDVAYHSSQPWPFPASLMLGYYAEALTEEIVLQADEMRDARWFTRAQINNRTALGFNLPPQISIARRLIEDWLAS